jgi:hypothetical protein
MALGLTPNFSALSLNLASGFSWTSFDSAFQSSFLWRCFTFVASSFSLLSHLYIVALPILNRAAALVMLPPVSHHPHPLRTATPTASQSVASIHSQCPNCIGHLLVTNGHVLFPIFHSHAGAGDGAHLFLCITAESSAGTLADASAKRQGSEGAFPHEFVPIIAFTHLHTA